MWIASHCLFVEKNYSRTMGCCGVMKGYYTVIYNLTLGIWSTMTLYHTVAMYGYAIDEKQSLLMDDRSRFSRVRLPQMILTRFQTVNSGSRLWPWGSYRLKKEYAEHLKTIGPTGAHLAPDEVTSDTPLANLVGQWRDVCRRMRTYSESF
jgi:hypothetical protein